MAGDAVELRPGVAGPADRREPRRAAGDDVRDAGQRLDVVHHRWLAEDADHRRKRRLEAREAALPLDRLDQRRLLAADVGAGAAVHPDVDVEPGAEGPLAQVPRGARLGDRLLEDARPAYELATDVDVGGARLDRVGGDRDPLEHHVRVVLDQLAVLERAGLGLVGVADQVAGAGVVPGHERPLAAGGEAGAAAAAQLGGEHLLGDRVRRHRQRFPQPFVAARRQVGGERARVGLAAGAQQHALHGHGLLEGSRKSKVQGRKSAAESRKSSVESRRSEAGSGGGERGIRRSSAARRAAHRAWRPSGSRSSRRSPGSPARCRRRRGTARRRAGTRRRRSSRRA